MKNKRKTNYFENVNSVINTLTESLGLEKGLRVSSVSKLWPNIVGPRFEKTSKIYSIYSSKGYDTALIAVKSSPVGQELSFYKSDVLRKLNKVGQNFGFNIKEVTFSTKYWKNNEKEQKTEKPHMPSESDLEKISIPESLLKSIQASVDENYLFNEELKERFLKTAVNDIKIRLWMKNNNYPLCQKCGIPMNFNTDKTTGLCPSCKYEEN